MGVAEPAQTFQELTPLQQSNFLSGIQQKLRLPRVPTYRQACVLLHPARGGNHPILYGGAKGGAKTALGVMMSVGLCRTVPDNRALIARWEYSALDGSTLEELRRQLKDVPDEEYRLVEGKHRVYWNNGAELWWMGLRQTGKQLEKGGKMGSTEFGSVFLDEAPDSPRQAFVELQQRLRHKPAADVDQLRLLLTGNPWPGWVKDDFYARKRPGYFFVRSLMDDNPHLPAGYKQVVQDSYQGDPAMARAMIDGDWDALTPSDQAIPVRLLNDALVRKEQYNAADITWGIDVARKGGDWTVVWERAGYVWRRVDRWRHARITQSADAVEALFAMARHKPTRINVDDSGVGGGLTDELIRRSFLNLLGEAAIGECVGGGRAQDVAKFVNMNAELVFLLRAILDAGRGQIVEDEDNLISGDLGSFWARLVGPRRAVDGNDAVRDRLGRSPDDGNAFLLTLYEGHQDQFAPDPDEEALAALPEEEHAIAMRVQESQARTRRTMEAFFGQVGINPFEDEDGADLPY